MADYVFRDATADDAAVVLQLVRDLAEYQGDLHEVHMTEADCRRLLAEGPAKALLVYAGDKPVAMALYYFNFSSWTGGRGVFLEDLFVKPEARGSGLGELLFRKMADLAVQGGGRRLEWNVLNWNSTAKGFYKRFGGFLAEGWDTWRLEGEHLHAAARGLGDGTDRTF